MHNGSLLLINRGWLAAGKALPPLPAVQPTVEMAAWPRFITLGPTPPEANRFQHVDPAAFARWANASLPVAYAYALNADGLIVDVPHAYLNADRHFAYMASWWGMTLAGALLWWRFRRGTR
ncbi:hypothetical protein JHS3_24270 [Jeongeupia sp. HS-3]|nr:hypothetical protein JHS3_24270 [Jeongeupia sp. HS-3]